MLILRDIWFILIMVCCKGVGYFLKVCLNIRWGDGHVGGSVRIRWIWGISKVVGLMELGIR